MHQGNEDLVLDYLRRLYHKLYPEDRIKAQNCSLRPCSRDMARRSERTVAWGEKEMDTPELDEESSRIPTIRQPPQIPLSYPDPDRPSPGPLNIPDLRRHGSRSRSFVKILYALSSDSRKHTFPPTNPFSDLLQLLRIRWYPEDASGLAPQTS